MYKIPYSPNSKQIGKIFKRGGKKGRKRGKREEKEEKRREKKEKRKKKRQKGKKIAVTILGSFFKSGMGRLSNSMEQYIPWRILK